MKKELEEAIRLEAENSLVSFIKLVAPERVLGNVHEELCSWWTRSDALSHQLVLLPRDHGKSAMIGYRVAWLLTKEPTLRVLYISATSNLAQKQLSFIKRIFESPIHRRFWPEHILEEEGKRAKWTQTEIELDHPSRRHENIRDPSIFTGGLTTSLTGLHCDVAVLDDVVVQENAYTNEGRSKVETQYSLLSSIEGANSKEWIVGTRYHPLDLYSRVMMMETDVYDEDTLEVVGTSPIYEKFEKQVESYGDGTGEFLWPLQVRKDGKTFGFNHVILAKKRAQYLDRLQFRAQYYNDPTDPESAPIDSSSFQYYDRKHLHLDLGKWFFKDNKLNVTAAVDFAYTTNKRSDYTAIVVAGMDSNGNTYVLDIVRFKTDKISEYFKHILALVSKWSLRTIRAETTNAQGMIVEDLKENYFKPNGLSVKIEKAKHTKHEGSKEERVAAALEARYANNSMWHYRGGNCQILEEELITSNPAHDDVKDALATALEGLVKPMAARQTRREETNVVYHPRFGGIIG